MCIGGLNCSLGKEKEDSELTVNKNTLHNSDANTNIIGEWQSCQEIDKQTTIQYNVCPVIIFGQNKSVYIKPSKVREPFVWELVNDTTLLIEQLGEIKNKGGIENGVYQIIFTYYPKYTELQLINNNLDLTYILSR